MAFEKLWQTICDDTRNTWCKRVRRNINARPFSLLVLVQNSFALMAIRWTYFCCENVAIINVADISAALMKNAHVKNVIRWILITFWPKSIATVFESYTEKKSPERQCHEIKQTFIDCVH